MPVEFFQEEGRGFIPKASVRQQGQIGFNQAAVRKFSLKNDQHALLGYDRDKKIVVIKLIGKEEKGSKKVVIRGDNGAISARGFFDFFEISHKKTKSYLLQLDEQNDYLFFSLETEKETSNNDSEKG